MAVTPPVSAQPASGNWLNTIGNFLNTNSGTIGSLLSTGSQLYGQQNAAQAISSAANAGIGQANKTMGNISSLYAPQTTLGNSSMNALASAEGLNGQPANYNNFLNMPGYQFAVNQGTQAIQRQAASMGSAYTPNTAQAVGQYVTGTAMQDYNTYIQQLQQNAQLGSAANSTLANSNLSTAGNIEQLGMNSGMAQAGMYTGMGATAGGAVGGPNASGTGGGASTTSGVTSLIGKGINELGNLFGSGIGSYAESLGGSTAAGAAAAAAPAVAADSAALSGVGDAALGSQLAGEGSFASVAGTNAGAAAGIGTDAGSSILGSTAGGTGAGVGNLAGTGAASAASGGAAGGGAASGAPALGGVGSTVAGLGVVGGIAAAGLLSSGVSMPSSYYSNLLSTVQKGRAAGYTSNTPIINSNGQVDPQYAAWINALQELQAMPGSSGTIASDAGNIGGYNTSLSNDIMQALNSMGYQSYNQMTPSGPATGGAGGGFTSLGNLISKA